MYEFYKGVDAYFKIMGGTIVESDEIMPGVIVDFDCAGNAVGIEWY